METKVDTLIVGGGIAGMFCAMRLKEAGLPFLMITERLGGRVMYKPEYQMNFGAVLFFGNDHNIKTILAPGSLALATPQQILLHRGDNEHYPLLSFRVFNNFRQIFKFRRFIKVFVKHYEVYKKNCETMQVKEALKADPFLERLFFMPSETLMTELGVTRGCEELTSFFAFTCTGVRVNALSAFDYCCLSQGLVTTMTFFSFDENGMHRRLGNVEFDSVVTVSKADGGYKVETAKGKSIEARNLVMATSADAAKSFIKLPAIRTGTRMFSYLVKGTAKPEYRKKKIHLFSDICPVLYLAKRDGTKDEFEVFANVSLDLGNYFTEYNVICSQEWPQAIYTHPSVLLDQDRGDNLYLAGDQHGIGMESAAISGIYAANRIIDGISMEFAAISGIYAVNRTGSPTT